MIEYRIKKKNITSTKPQPKNVNMCFCKEVGDLRKIKLNPCIYTANRCPRAAAHRRTYCIIVVKKTTK